MLCCGGGVQPNNQTMITVGFAVMGLSMMPLLPIALATAVEVTYPVPEEMSATLLMLVRRTHRPPLAAASLSVCAHTPHQLGAPNSNSVLRT